MSQTLISRPYTDKAPPFGPCLHEADGGAVSRDLCAVRSGDPKVNEKCGECASPYRLCRKCIREGRRRLATGEGLCNECKNPTPAVLATPSPEKKPVQFVPVRFVQKPAPVPKPEPVKEEPVATRAKPTEPHEKVLRTKKEKKPALRGAELSVAVSWYREIEEGLTKREIAARMGFSDQTVHVLSKCASLPDDVLALIETRYLSMQAALAIAPFPIAVRPKLADCIGHQAFPMWQLEYIALLVKRGQGSWHGLLKERLEFVVPVEDTLES